MLFSSQTLYKPMKCPNNRTQNVLKNIEARKRDGI